MPDDNSLVTTRNAFRLLGDLRFEALHITSTKTLDPLAFGSQHSTFIPGVFGLVVLLLEYTHYIFGFDHGGLKTMINIDNKIAGGIGEVKGLCFCWLSMNGGRYCEDSSNIQCVQRKGRKDEESVMGCCSKIARRSGG